jgi:hypothetical protein
MRYFLSGKKVTESDKEDAEVRRLMPSGRKPRGDRKYKPKREKRSFQRRRRIDTSEKEFDKDLSLSPKYSATAIAFRLASEALKDRDKLYSLLNSVSPTLASNFVEDFNNSFPEFAFSKKASSYFKVSAINYNILEKMESNLIARNKLPKDISLEEWFKSNIDTVLEYPYHDQMKFLENDIGLEVKTKESGNKVFLVDAPMWSVIVKTLNERPADVNAVDQALYDSIEKVVRAVLTHPSGTPLIPVLPEFEFLKEFAPPTVDQDGKKYFKVTNDAAQSLIKKYPDQTQSITKKLYSPPAEKPSEKSVDQEKSVRKYIDDQFKAFKRLSEQSPGSNIYSILKSLERNWNMATGEIPWGARAGYIESLRRNVENVQKSLPRSVQALGSLVKKSQDSSEVEKSLAELILGKSSDPDFEIDKDIPNFESWAVSLKLYEYLRANAELPSKDFKTVLDKFTKDVYGLMLELYSIKQTTDEFKKAVEQSSDVDLEDLARRPKYYDIDDALDSWIKAMEELDSAARKVDIVDSSLLEQTMLEKLKKQFPNSSRIKSLKLSSSNKPLESRMTRTATYHGVLTQGGPDGPYSGWSFLDKRYLNKDHYDAIIASAKEFLKGGWLQNNWNGSAPDVQIRAALDLAISTADNSAYQSKIDAPTYNMLLNRLGDYKTDLLSETLLTTAGKPKKASTMNETIGGMLKIAQEIKAKNPEAAARLASLIGQFNVDLIRTASEDMVAVDVNTLVRVAFENPGSRSVLMPIIAAKKKAVKKKSGKKASPKKVESSSSRSDDKKKASKKAGKKHKASVDSSDLSW